MQFFFSRSTQNYEKHEYIEHIMGIYNVPTREVGGSLMRYIDITLRCLVTPIFLLIDQFLYRFSIYWPKTNSEKSFFFLHRAVENFDHRGYPVFAKRDLGLFLAWKVFECNNHNNLLNPFNIISSQRLPSSGRKAFIFLQKQMNLRTATMTKFGNLTWSTT